MTKKTKTIIDCIEWLLIIGLIIGCILLDNKNSNTQIQQETAIKENTYTKIYESQTIESLKKQNKELQEKVSQLENAESAVEIKYRYLIKTDTVYKERFIELPDSIYHYENDNDTIHYNIDIKAKDLSWYKANITINDAFSIVNSTNNNVNSTVVYHSPNAEIEDVTAWKNNSYSLKDHIFYGPSVGIGYGLANGKFDVYVGLTVGYKF